MKPYKLKAEYISEPLLSFGHGQESDYTKDGLFLYGPHSGPDRPKDITVGVVGTNDGIKYLRKWSIKIGGHIAIPERGIRDKEHRLHLSNFPGIEAAFGIRLNPGEFVNRAIDTKLLDDAVGTLNIHEAVRKAVDIYMTEVEYHDKNEEQKIDIWLFVLPEIIFKHCRPQSKRTGLSLKKGEFSKNQNNRSDLPLFADILDRSDEDIFDDIPDFHRQVKARFLGLGYPSQLIRETTIAPDEFLNRAGNPIRPIQEAAGLAWNLSAGLYYKTQPEPPWKLAHVRSGVCYIGLVFKNIPNHPDQHVCCAAQMFLNEGDAVVFRGANGPWQTDKDEYHLSKNAAKALLSQVMQTFKSKHGCFPNELFIHGRGGFSDDEWQAFTESVPSETNVIAVRIWTTHGDMKLFRDGDYPVMRGSALILNDKNAYLWAIGFVPRLDSYIGPETPNPLFITVLKSTKYAPSIMTVLEDILGLTKINYNACNHSDGLPVTIRFANKVGEVLTLGSAKDSERQPLKFYI